MRIDSLTDVDDANLADTVSVISEYQIPYLESILFESYSERLNVLRSNLKDLTESLILPASLRNISAATINSDQVKEIQAVMKAVDQARSQLDLVDTQKGLLESAVTSISPSLSESKIKFYKISASLAGGQTVERLSELVQALKVHLRTLNEISTLQAASQLFDIRTSVRSQEIYVAQRFCLKLMNVAEEETQCGLSDDTQTLFSVKCPSLRLFQTVVEKYVSPTVGRHIAVRAFSKPAFKFRNGVQPDLEERIQMISDGLWCMEFLLNGKRGEIAKEVAKGE